MPMNPPRDSSLGSAFLVSVDHKSAGGGGDGAPLRNLKASFDRSQTAEPDSCTHVIKSSVVKDNLSRVQPDKDSEKEAFWG